MHTARRIRSAFTLMEILLVVLIVAILASIVVVRFTGINDKSENTAMTVQLRTIRDQIAAYRWQTEGEPSLIANQWADLTGNDFLATPPQNPLNGSAVVSGAAGANVGWIWRDRGDGVFDVFGTDDTFLAEFVE